MGKKTRKKKGGLAASGGGGTGGSNAAVVETKEARKERLLERRERRLQPSASSTDDEQNSNDNDNNNNNSDYDEDDDSNNMQHENEESYANAHAKRLIEVGDRVHYAESVHEEAWKWGVVQSLSNIHGGKTAVSAASSSTGEESFEEIVYEVLPWKASEDDKDALVEVRHQASLEISDSDKRRFPLIEPRVNKPWTLRFSPGTKVLCYFSPKSTLIQKGRYDTWRVATVDIWWPRWYDNNSNNNNEEGEIAFNHPCRFMCYRCIDDLTGKHIFISNDTEKHIVDFEDTKLRFSKGDKVVCLTNANRNQWERGTVVGTFVGGEAEGVCAGYSVRLDDERSGRSGRSSVFKVRNGDTDENIARVDAGPRQRLFDAIEQRCSFGHLDHLVNSTNLDVASFRDLILSKAIEACSYDALWWLQDTMNIDLSKIRDKDDKGLLHQISSLPDAHHFFKAANVKRTKQDDEGYGEVRDGIPMLVYSTLSEGVEGLITQVDRRRRWWLHHLVISGNVRALDCVFSPQGQLALDLSSAVARLASKNSSSNEVAVPSIHAVTRDEKGINIRDAAKMLGRHDMVKMIDDFAMWQTVYDLSSEVQRGPDLDKIKANILPKFGDVSSGSVLRKLNRMLSVRSKRDPIEFQSLREVCRDLARRGDLPMLSWLVEGYPPLLDDTSSSKREEENTSSNVNEFAQPELFDVSLENGQLEQMGLVSLVAHGEPPICAFTDDARIFYAVDGILSTNFVHERSGTDLSDYIKTFLEHEPSYFEFREFLEYKLRLLSDDESLRRRLEVLTYLVKEKGQRLPPVYDIIRWRQCGVLRWMVSESFVDLKKAVADDPAIAGNAKKFQFLADEGLPKTTSVGEFLCFVAVEYDDLQTIQWLVREQNIPVTSTKCHGWTLLHCCAFFGRTEIAHWVLCHVTKSSGAAEAKQFISVPCGREGQRHMFACHLAVQRGYIQLAEFLLWSGCPPQDTNGKSTGWYAKRSAHDFVIGWGQQNEQLMKAKSHLENDITILFKHLSSPDDSGGTAKAMDHISKSKCLEIKRWQDLEFDNAATVGPSGKTFKDVIEDCCKLGTADFLAWLCGTLTPTWSCMRLGHVFIFAGFWRPFSDGDKEHRLYYNELLEFATDRIDGGPLITCLRTGKRWTAKIECHEPNNDNPLLKEILKHRGGDDSVTAAMAKVRDDLLLDELLFHLFDFAKDEVCRMLASVAPVETINKTLKSIREIAKDRYDESPWHKHHGWMLATGGVMDLDRHLPCDYGSNHPLKNNSHFIDRHPGNLHATYVVFAVEGSEELIRWSLEPGRSSWETTKELETIRIAAYLGHGHVVDIFLKDSGKLSLSSTLAERKEAALLGALEAGFVDDIENRGLLSVSTQSDFSKWTEVENPKSLLPSSLVGVAIFGCMIGRAGSRTLGHDRGLTDKDINALKWVEKNVDMEPISFVRAATIASSYQCAFNFGKFIDMFTYLIKEQGLNPFECQPEIIFITAAIAFHWDGELMDDQFIREWLALVMKLGLDIQSLGYGDIRSHVARHEAFLQVIRPLQAEQRGLWSQFDVIRHGGTLEAMKEAITSGTLDLSCYDSNGLKPVHVATAYDRLDILEWLADVYPMQLNELDGAGRSVLAVALASNASNVYDWISRRTNGERISVFLSSLERRKLALKEKRKRLCILTTIQALYRGYIIRRAYRGQLVSRLEEAQRFKEIWRDILRMVDGGQKFDCETTSWSAIKTKRFDLLDSMDEKGEDSIEFLQEDHAETTQKLASAASLAATAQPDETLQTETIYGDDKTDQPNKEAAVPSMAMQAGAGFKRILLTRAVLRWRRQADSRYLGLFIDRITQLACGDRSLLLKKSLTGCKTTIFEAKLDAGQRILWTEESHRGLIVWYVAKHDDVSRLVRLMDKAESRSCRQLTASSDLPEIEDQVLQSSDTQGSLDEVLLDPQGDTPLRLYDIRLEDIDKLRDSSLWEPPLHLTAKERDIVDTEGTVLLLGRSGTGKTICICNRIDSDRYRAQDTSSFKQLFVARSKRICNMVEKVVGKDYEESIQSHFRTFGRLLVDCETELPAISEESHSAFLPSKKMDFPRFKREVCRPGSSTLDPLLVWTQIRSLIKGSIAELGQPRSKDEYMALGRTECRLSLEQRDSCYSVFEAYERHMKQSKLWDDCDRVTCLIRQLQADPEVRFAIAYDKVYIDEIQDYTQVEIALFFMLSRHHGDLFLAGDPAQSVVEGSDFRFEDIRTVAHHLFHNEKKSGKKGIPNKPLKLNVNFRSHAGILNVASGVLDLLFSAFPGSAKELPKDKGLFLGPRPGVFMNVEPTKLRELLSKINGAYVLTHDGELNHIKHCLGDYALLLGIRESKGLEFKDVVLVDFFKGLSTEHQKPWRNLLRGRNEVDLKPGFPEIESHLKLLYTAITRCSGRLFIAETGSSIAGQAFVRWATSHRNIGSGEDVVLAVKQEVQDVEKMVRTPDEWRSNGVDNAMHAESLHDLMDAQCWFDKAIYCFGQVGDTDLARKARTNRASVQFRHKLEHSVGNQEDVPVDHASIEFEAAEILERLLSEHLTLEARKVVDLTLPLLSEYSNENLRKELLPVLPTQDDE